MKSRAPPAPGPVTGANQSDLKHHNERLILSLVRHYRQLSKREVAGLTGLTAQTTTVTINRLQSEQLLRREKPVRGRVGQPTVPVSLNPEGAYGLGLMIGRRHCSLGLMNLCGVMQQQACLDYAYPAPGKVIGFLEETLPKLIETLDPAQRQKIQGLGIAMPFQLWQWAQEIGAPIDELEGWRSQQALKTIEQLSPYRVTTFNDATSACAAEYYYGEGWQFSDYLYFSIGLFIGGGLVLNGSLYLGRTGNAAAVGSIPVSAGVGEGGQTTQLIARASLHQLERMLQKAGKDPTGLWMQPEGWQVFEPYLSDWLEEASSALAQAIIAALSINDVAAIILDGTLPSIVRQRLVELVEAKYHASDRRGLSPAQIIPGAIGPDAQLIGAAALPLIALFERRSP